MDWSDYLAWIKIILTACAVITIVWLLTGCGGAKFCSVEYWEHSCPEEGHGPCFICDN